MTFLKKCRYNQRHNKYIFNDVFLDFSDVLENVTIVIKEEKLYSDILKTSLYATIFIHPNFWFFPHKISPKFSFPTFFFLFIRLPLFSLHSHCFSLSPHHISSLPQLLPPTATPTAIALAIDLLWLDLEKSMFTFIYISQISQA